MFHFMGLLGKETAEAKNSLLIINFLISNTVYSIQCTPLIRFPMGPV